MGNGIILDPMARDGLKGGDLCEGFALQRAGRREGRARERGQQGRDSEAAARGQRGRPAVGRMKDEARSDRALEGRGEFAFNSRDLESLWSS